jgi:hypothetical protein
MTKTFILLFDWLSKKEFCYKTDWDAVWYDYKEKSAPWLGIWLKSMLRQTWRGDIDRCPTMLRGWSNGDQTWLFPCLLSLSLCLIVEEAQRKIIDFSITFLGQGIASLLHDKTPSGFPEVLSDLFSESLVARRTCLQWSNNIHSWKRTFCFLEVLFWISIIWTCWTLQQLQDRGILHEHQAHHNSVFWFGSTRVRCVPCIFKII